TSAEPASTSRRPVSPRAHALGITVDPAGGRRAVPSTAATSPSAPGADEAGTSRARVASACGSRSTTRVGNCRARAAEASPSTTEVLPPPPLRLHTLTTITARRYRCPGPDAEPTRPGVVARRVPGRAGNVGIAEDPCGRVPARRGAEGATLPRNLSGARTAR